MKNGFPVAAIIGRPNVGKSSLFNMMIGERKSIVDEMEGVTRDINMKMIETEKSAFYLYDTAGYLEKGDEFNKLVQEKVRQAIADAEIVLFMVDGRDYHPIDDQLAVFLSQQKKPVIVVANKLDNPKMAEQAVYEFYNLGFDEVMPISVLQRRGFRELLERLEKQFKKFKPPKKKDKEIRISIVGKPNVGKSCLLNTLLGYERSIVSPVPGTTRDPLDDVIQYEGNTIRLVDTAGLRRKNKVDEDIEYYSNIRAVHAIESSHVVIQLFDATEPVSMQDKRITQLIQERGRALVAVFNKWDEAGSDDAEENYRKMQEFRKTFADEFPALAFVPLEFISAKDNYKIDRLMETVMKVYADYFYRVPTAKLNQWIEREIKESRTEKRVSNLNVYYVTQTYSAPPRFVFFINKKDYLRKDHPRYFENKLREAFEFKGVPINITFREKGEKVED